MSLTCVAQCTICSAKMVKKELRKVSPTQSRINVSRQRLTLPQHVKVAHGISLRTMIKHSKKPAKVANDKEQTTPVHSPTESSDVCLSLSRGFGTTN